MDTSIYIEFEQVSLELVDLCRVSYDTEEKVSKILQLLSIVKRMSDREQQELFVPFEVLKALRLLLCDIDKKLRVQASRVIRYITCNDMILTTMVSINIPMFMMICLEREDNKYYWERLGALKWVRHLIDNYPLSIPKCCILSLIAIATNGKHEYQRICVDSLRELCIINPQIVNKCNGFKVLIDLVLNPQLNEISHSLVLTILYILDHPNTRKYLRPSLDIQRLLSPFVAVNPAKPNKAHSSAQNKAIMEAREARREIARQTVLTMLKSITGIFYLGSNDKMLRILVDLMKLPNAMTGIQWARKTIFSVLDSCLIPLGNNTKHRGPNLIVNYVCLILMAFIRNGLVECLVDVGMRSDLDLAPRARQLLQRIQFLSAKYLPPKLCSKITSIERVMNDAATFTLDASSHSTKLNLEVTVQRNFANMMISELTEDASLELDESSAVIKSHGGDSDDEDDERDSKYILSQTICSRLGVEFDLNSTFIRYRYMLNDADIPSSLIFGDRIPYHAHRQNDVIHNSNNNDSQQSSNRETSPSQYEEYNKSNASNASNASHFNQFSFKSQKNIILNSLKFDQNASYSENQIIDKLRETQVIQTKDYMLWDMDKVWKILNGPLWNITNLNVALIKTRFIKRLLQYLKPSKLLFTSLKCNMQSLRHAQCAAQLFRVLTSCDIGCKHQYFIELISEIFQCLKDQIDLNIGKIKLKINSEFNPFSRKSMTQTLAPTYITLIGILSETRRGLQFFSKHNMITYLITDHTMSQKRIVGPNDYLLRLIATNLDYTVDNTFPLLFNKWIAKGSYCLRKTLITHLELLYRAQMPKFDEWSIDVLAIILKSSEQRLALTALKVLEKINLSQNSMKAQQYLIDFIHTQPTDEVIGEYGQFLFIKMLSTQEGLQFLQQNDWLNNKRRDWSNVMHTKYTSMLETALVLSVSNDTKNVSSSDTAENDDWLPYHLLYEDRSDEEELFAEYLTQFPWAMKVEIIGETSLCTDCFFDHNCFYYRNNAATPIGLGAGVVAIIIERETGCDRGHALKHGAKIESLHIRISLSIGDGCLNELYSKKSLTKVVSCKNIQRYAECSVIIEDQIYLFFNNNNELIRIFWSLSEVRSNKKVTASLVRPLPHFYGELAKTNEGCTYILSNDEFNMDLQQFIFTVHSAFLEMVEIKGAQNDEENKLLADNYTIDSAGTLVDNNSNLQLRSCLWALGMIGSSPTGLNLLNSLCNNSNGINIIDDICILTLESPTLSIRGTCLYVLGLLSRTKIGMQQLSKYGFGFPADNLELDLAVAIPEDVDDFFKVQQTAAYIDSPHVLHSDISCYSPPHLCRPNNMKPLDPNELLGKQGHTEETILAHISSLCNNVTQKSSASALHGLRMRKPSVFTNPLLFREACKLLNTYQFKLAAKRFILFNLFDQVILDADTCELFNDSLAKPILSYKRIREWRYNYKQTLIEKKKRERAQRHAKHSSYHHINAAHASKHRSKQNKPKSNAFNVASVQNVKNINAANMAKNINHHNVRANYNQQNKTINNNKNNNQNNIQNDSYAAKLSRKLAKQQQKQIQQKEAIEEEHEVVIEIRGRQRSDATQNKKAIINVGNNPYSMSSQFGAKKKMKIPPQINNNNNAVANKNNKWITRPQVNVGNGIQRRISELQGVKPNKVNEYADSPTKHVAGPNPLQSDQSQNYD